MRTSSYTALFQVSLRGVGHKCVGLAQKIYLRAATRVSIFFPFPLLVFLFSSLHYHTCMFFLFPQRVPSDLEVGYEIYVICRLGGPYGEEL